MSSIYNFNKGDIITRIQRSTTFNDGSYRGCKMIYIGICNNQIQCMTESIGLGLHITSLNLEECEEGWDYYTKPCKIIGDEILDNIDIEIIEKYLRRKKLNKIKQK